MNRCLLRNFVVIILGAVILGAGKSVSALTYQYGMPVSFTFNPMVRLNLSSNLVISDLAPGTASDSNIITVNVVTNTMYGYKLNATVGNNTTYNTRNLVHSDSAATATFASVDYATTPTITATADLDDNTWAYAFSTDNGTTWANYNGLPLYNDETNVALLKESTGPVAEDTGDNVNFKIAAKASSSQIAGEYNNVISFIAVATPEPTPQPITCSANTICYAPNALDVEDTMGDQSASSNASTDLWPSNFKRERYGFIGWNTELDGSGEMYGPMETITTGDLSTKGLALYATWVESAGYMQNWDGCSAMSIGDVTALTDIRDEDTYAVAKLADGKCWMIENLRLADKDSDNNAIVLSSSNTNNPSLPLTNTWWYSSANDSDTPTTSNSLSIPVSPSSSTPWCTTNNANCDDQSMLSTNNTTSTIANQTGTGQNIYSYGNYYNWYSATAGNGKNANGTSDTSVDGDLCPTGWKLPEGGRKPNIANSDFWILSRAVIGSDPANFANNYFYYTGNEEGKNASDSLRAYPNNFLYSGYAYGTSLSVRGRRGRYWSSTTINNISAYLMSLDSSSMYPGTYIDNKCSGYPVRCLADS